MTGQEVILQLMKTDPKGQRLKDKYWTVKEAFEQEFGLAWVLKEIAEVREDIKPGHRHPHQDLVTILHTLFADVEKKLFLRQNQFVGTRKLNSEEWALYQKGIYFITCYQVLKDLR